MRQKLTRLFPLALQWSLFSVMTLVLVVVVSSCSKKEVAQDEPLISPSTGSDGAGSLGDQAAVPTESTGSVGGGETSGEMKEVFFDFDSYRINSDGRNALNADAEWLKANPNVNVQVEGHCDERGTTEYNLALGERRANAARDYLVKLGVAKSRVSVISYGEERPADPGHDESAWARNRRASFVILNR